LSLIECDPSRRKKILSKIRISRSSRVDSGERPSGGIRYSDIVVLPSRTSSRYLISRCDSTATRVPDAVPDNLSLQYLPLGERTVEEVLMLGAALLLRCVQSGQGGGARPWRGDRAVLPRRRLHTRRRQSPRASSLTGREASACASVTEGRCAVSSIRANISMVFMPTNYGDVEII